MSWLSGFTYRKKITITGQTGAGTDYQVLLKIGETSGASGEDFDLENHSLIFPSDKNEGGDLRFTTDDESTLLDFWVEKVTGTTPNRLAYVWVEVSADLGSNQDIYCYYANAGASNYSDGEATFPFFDDFPDSSLDGSKWTESGTVVVSSSEVNLDSNDIITGKTFFGFGYAYRALAKADEQDTSFIVAYDDDNNRTVIQNIDADYPDDFDRIAILAFKSGSNERVYNNGWNDFRNTYYVYELQRIANNNLKYSQENNSNTYTNTTYIHTGDSALRLRVWSPQASTLTVDWSLVRKCIDTEPAYSSADSEEKFYESVELADTIYLSDAFNYPEAILSDTITLSDSLINDIAHYATRITRLDTDNMLIVTDTDPAEIIKVDISGGTPIFRIHPLLTAKNAIDVTVNSTFDKIYVACADGKVVKLASADLTDKTLLDTEDTDDLTSIDCLDSHYYTYAGTDDSEGEIILIDESEITKLNSDIRFLIQTETIINSQINTIKASIIDSDIRFLRTTSTIVNSDIRFAKYTYSEETPIARTDFHVFINGVETGDVALDSIRVVRADEQKDMAYFSVARKHDDLDRTLEAVASQITNQNAVIVKIEDRTIFTGTIKEIQCYSTEKVDVTAESADVGTVDFSTVNLGLQDTSHQIHLYDVILDDINIFNPTIDASEENPVKYKGVSVDLGIENWQHVQTEGESGADPRTAVERRLYDRNIKDEINEGTFKPDPEWTYFWWVSGWKKDEKGFWNLLNYKKLDNFFSVNYQNSWFYTNLAYYIGTSLSSSSSGIYYFDSVRYVKQKVSPVFDKELGNYTLGSAPYNTVSSKNGKETYPTRYEDHPDFGLIKYRPLGRNHVDYAKEIAAIEFAKMKTINDEVLPITRANINLTIDAFLYYAIQLNTRINLDNTTVAGTYKNNNGFPVSVKGIEINSNSMQVRLICDNEKSKYELDALDATMPDEDDPKYYVPQWITGVSDKLDLDTDEIVTSFPAVLIMFPQDYSDSGWTFEVNTLVKYP